MSIRQSRVEYMNSIPQPRPKKLTRKRLVEMMTHQMKKSLLRQGVVKHTEPKWWAWMLTITCGESIGGKVSGFTRSEARSHVKEALLKHPELSDSLRQALGTTKKGRLHPGVEIIEIKPSSAGAA